MITKVIYVDNFAEALLRSALLLGNLHRTCPIRNVSIYAFSQKGSSQTRSLQCVISMASASVFNPRKHASSDVYVDYDILFPLYYPKFS